MRKWKRWLFLNLAGHRDDHYYSDGSSVYLSFTGDCLYQFDVRSNRGKAFEAEAAKQIAETLTRVTTLFDAIVHGDPKHREWLRAAIIDHFEGKPIKQEAG